MKNKLPTLFLGLLLISGSNLVAQNVVTTLSADGPGDTYELITSVLAPNANPIEVPDTYHDPSEKHISEIFDNDLNKNVFSFVMHVDPDREIVANRTDRQRNEIKSYDASPEKLLARRGELVEYNWKFKMDNGFQPGTGFTHLFQLKAKGGLDGPPLITISPRRKNPDNKLELIYRRDDGNGDVTNNIKVRELNLSDFVGKWLEVTCRVYVNGTSSEIAEDVDGVYMNFQQPGSIEFEIKEVDTGNVLMEYSNFDIDMDRSKNGFNSFKFLRPKWGIYRSLDDKISLRDETVLFADFKITEFDQALGIEDFDITGAAIQRNPVQDILRINPDLKGSIFSVYALTGQKILSTSSLEIDLSDRATGLYFLNIEKGSSRATINFSIK